MRHASRLLVALILPSMLSAQQVERVVLEGRNVAIYNLAGRVRVEGGTGDRVVVELTRGGRDAARLRVETGEIRGRMTMRVRYPGDRIRYSGSEWNGRTTIRINEQGIFGDNEGRWEDLQRVEIDSDEGGLDAHADLRIIVPRGMTFALRQGAGETTVDNVEGTLSVEVHAAGVRVSRVRGSLSLESGSGGAEISDVTGALTAESGSGGLTVTGVRGGAMTLESGSGGLRASAIDVPELEAEAGSGGIRLKGVKTSRLRVETGSGGSEVELLSAASDVSIETGSGGVTLRMPPTTSATVDIETGSGDIETDFEVRQTRIERRALRGTIGSGSGRIRIETGSGRVHLVKS
jgi:lia operon protein LiaG